jgi:two-component system sensor histidine kinase CpxA
MFVSLIIKPGNKMGRLFWKIFITFWLAVIAISFTTAWVTVYFSTYNNQPVSQRFPLAKKLIQSRQAAANLITHKGVSEFENSAQYRRSQPIKFFLLNQQGQEVLGQALPAFLAAQHDALLVNQQLLRLGRHLLTTESVTSPQGDHYQLIGIAALTTPWLPRQLVFLLKPQRLLIALLVSGFICFWLTRYITGPVRRLRQATRQLATGKLQTRVAASFGSRRDEIAQLGYDFDSMAGQLTQLLASQRQLLSDLAHELRSPLARLEVAVELAKSKVNQSAQPTLERIETDLNCLNDIISQMLTLAKLESLSQSISTTQVSIDQLIQQIVQDARFESQRRYCRIQCTPLPQIKLTASRDLLYRAIENVLRNAIRYTAEASTVKVALTTDNSDWITITIKDQGPGIPADALSTIFQPFTRIANSRDRTSGGYGLGLAIAKRAVEWHQGAITAQNHIEGGLVVSIRLPLAYSHSSVAQVAS